MGPPKRVLCIMDLSGVGRCSLAVVSPVLSACGVQACPLPTALFSAHTGGFGTPVVQDMAQHALASLAHYKEQGIGFDAVYTGYLRTQGQFDAARQALAQYPDALHVVDPAIADNGKLYSSITPGMVQEMRALAQNAGLITPNYTESAILCGAEPTTAPLTPQEVKQRLATLAQNGTSVLITSLPTPQKTLAIAGCGPGGEAPFTITAYHVPQSYPGTGDLFTAAVTGLLLRGASLRRAATAAADFVRSAAIATVQAGADPRQGVWFEGQLAALALAANAE